ncbi:glycosyltransferase family 4 protein [Ideonella sp. B7]|uniref:glycosyltransferase family 4 protein n=1 Tax=Ideonella benzenivorans TaxID=2831643 RepID=UPI001CED1287|nr:glycosyltransferase family 4 protein [Ideonella benzenivorans]MCA6218231.1 glycosyltransferase family 4 protein [Ideonella benzenivorans]
MHSYATINKKHLAMSAMAKFLGKEDAFILLGPKMQADFLRVYTTKAHLFPINNSGFISQERSHSGPEPASTSIRLGHLSNLTIEKGLDLCIDLAVKCKEQGLDVTLTLAGPVITSAASAAIEKAKNVLGESLIYRGPLYGAKKNDFYQEIDFFIFPSSYVNEAYPLVILESISNGVPCISLKCGGIEDIIGENGGLLVSQREEFIGSALNYLEASRQRKETLKDMALSQFSKLEKMHTSELQSWLSALK